MVRRFWPAPHLLVAGRVHRGRNAAREEGHTPERRQGGGDKRILWKRISRGNRFCIRNSDTGNFSR
jgi:hypothetical protein